MGVGIRTRKRRGVCCRRRNLELLQECSTRDTTEGTPYQQTGEEEGSHLCTPSMRGCRMRHARYRCEGLCQMQVCLLLRKRASNSRLASAQTRLHSYQEARCWPATQALSFIQFRRGRNVLSVMQTQAKSTLRTLLAVNFQSATTRTRSTRWCRIHETFVIVRIHSIRRAQPTVMKITKAIGESVRNVMNWQKGLGLLHRRIDSAQLLVLNDLFLKDQCWPILVIHRAANSEFLQDMAP